MREWKARTVQIEDESDTGDEPVVGDGGAINKANRS